MIPELGHFSLILAMLVAALLGSIPMLGAARADGPMMAFARPAARLHCALVILAFACLAWAFANNDFSVAYVAAHSNSHLPLAYRLAAVWGGHEGSLLLWGLMLSGWMAAVSFARNLPEVFAARVLAVLGLVSLCFLAFLLFTSSPFSRSLPAFPEGGDLNPMLQDPGMVIHPPILYMGYVGFSVAYAFAIAGLIGGQFDAAWARQSRPWTLTAWMFLTLGITLGSGWSYYVLGWGGWWFWDPVENASFMPWLVGTALIHSLSVSEKRGAFKSWTILLAIGTFSLSLLGTFLVRSGVLTSVHAFAADPRRGIFILALLVAVVGGSLLLYAWRAAQLGGGGKFDELSRDTLLLVNNVLLAVAAGSVLLGTLYPIMIDAFGQKISVGPPYFDAVFLPLMAPVVFLMVIAPFVRWKTHPLTPLLRKLLPGLITSLLLGGFATWLTGQASARAFLGLSLAAWILLGSLLLLKDRLFAPSPAERTLTRLIHIPGAWWGMWLAHLGIGIFIIGVTLVKGLETNADVAVQVGHSAELAGYRFTLNTVRNIQGPNYTAQQGDITLSHNGQIINVLHPEKRLYTAQNMPMTEASIEAGLFRDLYVSLGESPQADTWILRLYYKPFVRWIWAGCLLMTFGGLCAALDARYRKRTGKKTSA